MRTIPTLESLWHDCRHAARMLRKNRTFAATVVLTLALGIGANTAIFSICNAVLLKPLPYADPDRIVMLWEQMGNGKLIPVSPANFVDWRRQTRSFSAVAAINAFRSFVLTGSGEPVRLTAAAVSFNFFTVLGTPIAVGRDFLQEEDQPGRNPVAILAHADLDRSIRRTAGHPWQDRHAQRHQLYGCRRAAAGFRVRRQGGGLPGANPVRRLGAAGPESHAFPGHALAARLCPARARDRPGAGAGRRGRPRREPRACATPRKTKERGFEPSRFVSR